MPILALLIVLLLAAREPDRRRVTAGRAGRTARAKARDDQAELARLRAETMAEWIARKLAEAPPLSDDQRARLARLLTGESAA